MQNILHIKVQKIHSKFKVCILWHLMSKGESLVSQEGKYTDDDNMKQRGRIMKKVQGLGNNDKSTRLCNDRCKRENSFGNY